MTGDKGQNGNVFSIVHGGDIYRNKVMYDFSVNINPLGMPDEVVKELLRHPNVWEKYPDPLCMRLRATIAAYYRVNAEQVLFGNGATEVLQLLIRELPHGKVILPVPSFQEYEHLLRSNGYMDEDICFFSLDPQKDFVLDQSLLEMISAEHSLLIIGNPNNPAGGIVEKNVLLEILDRCLIHGVNVISDQCFWEMSISAEHGENFTSELINKFPNVYIVDAVTKMYAMAGLRLGYCFHQDSDRLEQLRQKLPCWNVSGPAQLAGALAFSQDAYRKETAILLQKERAFLTEGLIKLGAKVYGKDTPFILFYLPVPIYDQLLMQGILIRDGRNWRGLGNGYYRIGVRTHEENRVLLSALERLV